MFCLEDLFLFNGLSNTETKEIISGFSPAVAFKKGEVIYSAEQFPAAIGVCINGKAVAVTNNGSKVHMNTFESGTCFGAAAVFGGGENYVSTIIAKTDIEILFITEKELRSLFLEFPVTAVNYITFLSDKIRFLNTKLGVISCGSAEDTVYKYLSTVTDSESFAHIPDNMTRLAKMLGLGRASLYRSLDNLEADKKIIRENNRIKVIKNEKNY